MVRIRKRKCPHCKTFFLPDVRNAKRQQFCTKPECRKASKQASQQRWLAKPENRDHFRGPDHVERVRQWREAHPGYWRKKDPAKSDALQDHLSQNTENNQDHKPQLVSDALQDLLTEQHTVLIGLISNLTGSALQDDIAMTTRRLRQLGRDIVNGNTRLKGENHDAKEPRLSTADPKGSQTVQLGGSPPGS